MNQKRKIAALIVAGGSGSRAGGAVPKQYQAIDGTPMLTRSLQAFLQHEDVELVQAVIRPEDAALYADATAMLDGLEPAVHGGETRQASVQAGLQALANSKPDIVLIHDAARPFVSTEVIDRVIEALEGGAEAVLPAIGLTDTIKERSGNKVGRTLNRDTLLRAQTPQGFVFSTILAQHHAHAGNHNFTDDVALCEAAGIEVQWVKGEERNKKVTHKDDFSASNMPAFRVGKGYDVHAFEAHGQDGNQIRVCGVDIAHPYALVGHSDADVGLHAATDAVLGAVAAGDIGQHFSPKDPRWKDADSVQFCAHAAMLCRKAGYKIANMDIILIGESPKFGPHRDAMQQAVANAFSITAEQVSIKATTTEKLGFTGRREGLAAEAVVLVERV